MSCVIVLSRIPAPFCDWLVSQLWFLREAGFQLKISILLLIDALPCSWTALSHLRGSRLDARRFDTFRSNTVCFDPCVHTAIISPRNVFCVWKKIRIITFSTAGLDCASPLTCRLWQEQKITPFQATPRLVIDYEAHDDLTILALAQVCAYRMNLEIPVQALRSFSSTRDKPRKMLHFDFGSEQVGRSEQELTACFRAHFGSRNLQQVAIGNESLFTLPDNSFILTYNRLGWIDDVSIGRLVTSVVLVSGFKAVTRLDMSQTVDNLK